jgi:hypothetical protein
VVAQLDDPLVKEIIGSMQAQMGDLKREVESEGNDTAALRAELRQEKMIVQQFESRHESCGQCGQNFYSLTSAVHRHIIGGRSAIFAVAWCVSQC